LIRQLAVQVLQLMQKEAPHLFNDYELTPLPDGTFEATTRYRKVRPANGDRMTTPCHLPVGQE